jgi:1,4-alpha-glucan branching enzyme
MIILNVTPAVRRDVDFYFIGKAKWKEIFNSDAKEFWGTGDVFNPSIPVELVDKKEKKYKVTLHLPPLAGIVLGCS